MITWPFDRYGALDWCHVLSERGHEWCDRRNCNCECHVDPKWQPARRKAAAEAAFPKVTW